MLVSARRLVCALLGAWLMSTASARADDTTRVPALDQLGWLVGEWTQDGERSVTVERWRRLGERVLEGRSDRSSKQLGRVVFSEQLLIVAMGADVYYVAKVPQNEWPVSFRLEQLEGQRAVFVNRDHDFPQRISYRLEQGVLRVTVDSLDPADERVLEFRLEPAGQRAEQP